MIAGGGRVTLLDRIAEHRAGLAAEADRLRKQLGEVEEELERIVVAQQVVTRLIEEAGDPGERVGGVTYTVAAGADAASPVRARIPYRHDVQGPADLPADYRDLLAAVADAREPVRCKQVCARLDLGTEPKHVEGARSKLKRLADRGWLRRNGAGMFTAVP